MFEELSGGLPAISCPSSLGAIAYVSSSCLPGEERQKLGTLVMTQECACMAGMACAACNILLCRGTFTILGVFFVTQPGCIHQFEAISLASSLPSGRSEGMLLAILAATCNAGERHAISGAGGRHA